MLFHELHVVWTYARRRPIRAKRSLQSVVVAAIMSRGDLLARRGLTGLGVHQQGDNKTVETCVVLALPEQAWRGCHTQNFGENENQNHSDEQPGLLGGSSYTSVTDNSDSEASGHTGETDGKTSTELDEVGEQRGVLFQAV